MTVIAPPGAAEDAPRVLLIDNYDSFTYNLAHLLCESGAVVDVRRHDAVTPEEADALAPTHLVVSPGPGRPSRGGHLGGADRALRGPRAGARRVPRPPVHRRGLRRRGRARAPADARQGRHRRPHRARRACSTACADSFEAGRYHSLAAIEPLPEVLIATARDRDGEVMALRHRDIPHLHGVQFHPESVLTPAGDVIARNFLAMGSAA